MRGLLPPAFCRPRASENYSRYYRNIQLQYALLVFNLIPTSIILAPSHPRRQMSAAGRFVDPGEPTSLDPEWREGDIRPAQGVEDDEPCSLSSLRSVGQTCDHTQMPRPNDLNRFLGEPGVPWMPVLRRLVVFFVKTFTDPTAHESDRALMSSKEIIPHTTAPSSADMASLPPSQRSAQLHGVEQTGNSVWVYNMVSVAVGCVHLITTHLPCLNCK